MPDPISFTSASARYRLPYLFSGQSQREVFVNEAHALIDALLHAAVAGTGNAPPATPEDGECWLVGDAPTGAWIDRAGALASYQAGDWLFVEPRDGMAVLDGPTGQQLRFREGWQRPDTPAAPTGGATIDAEARTAIGELVEALIAAGVLAQN
jgi:hypothetical protein